MICGVGKLETEIYNNNPCTLEALKNGIQSVILEITEAELLHVSHNLLHVCKMCINVGVYCFQQLLYEVSKMVLLITYLWSWMNFKLNHVIAVSFIIRGNLNTGWFLTVQTSGIKAINKTVNIHIWESGLYEMTLCLTIQLAAFLNK
jgi:hypothetical protein